VISERAMAGQTIALVRWDDQCIPGPGLDCAAPTFDELVLGYLEREPDRRREEAAA
jgi:hypothetical protein